MPTLSESRANACARAIILPPSLPRARERIIRRRLAAHGGELLQLVAAYVPTSTTANAYAATVRPGGAA